MTHYSESIPPPPAGWTVADEGYGQVTKLDYNGNEYTVWEKKAKGLNYGQLWKRFKERELPRSGGTLVSVDKVNEYEERKLKEHE